MKIKRVIKELKDMGVTRKYLNDNFIIAGLTIGHLLNKEDKKNEGICC